MVRGPMVEVAGIIQHLGRVGADHVTPEGCLGEMRGRSYRRRVTDHLTSWVTWFLQGFHTLHAWTRRAEMVPYATLDPADTNPKLFVFLHGLNASPAQARPVIKALQVNDPLGITYYVPPIREKGGAAQEKVIGDLFGAEKPLQKWIANHPQGSIVVMGVSNGGRLLRRVEQEILELAVKQQTEARVRCAFVSVVAAANGSSWMNLAHLGDLSQGVCMMTSPASKSPARWRMKVHSLVHKIATRFISEPNYRELYPGCPTLIETEQALERATSAIQQQGGIVAAHHYYAVSEGNDWTVPNTCSSLPPVYEGVSSVPTTTYTALYGQGHNSASAVGAVYASRILQCYTQMNAIPGVN